MGDYTDKVLDHKKYNLMGINPKEIYLRQTKQCWLEIVSNNCVKDKEAQDILYCTDGKEYAECNKMLNPTFECIKCLTTFISKTKESNDR